MTSFYSFKNIGFEIGKSSQEMGFYLIKCFSPAIFSQRKISII